MQQMQQTYIVVVDGAWEDDGQRRIYWIQGERIVRVFLYAPWEKPTEDPNLDSYRNVTVEKARLLNQETRQWEPVHLQTLTKEIAETIPVELILRSSLNRRVATRVIFFRPADPKEEATLLTSATPTVPPPDPELKSEPLPLVRISAPPALKGNMPSIGPHHAGPDIQTAVQEVLPVAPASPGVPSATEVMEERDMLREAGHLRPSPLPVIPARHEAASYAPSAIPKPGADQSTVPSPPPFSSAMKGFELEGPPSVPARVVPLPGDLTGRGPKRRS